MTYHPYSYIWLKGIGLSNSCCLPVPTFTWDSCLGLIMVIYTMYYVNWMWISLVGEPVVLHMAVLVGFCIGMDLS